MPWSRAQPRVAWFGKLPGQGDFVGRRMPRAMSGAWDEWLSHGLGHLRSTAHGDWERTFTQAPLWSFVASGGKGAAPSCGVLAPSIDRVGRCYPLTVMAVGEGGRQSLAADGVLGQFFSEACDAVIEARRLALPADALDTRLSRLPWPFAATAPDGRGAGAATWRASSPISAWAGPPGRARRCSPVGGTSCARDRPPASGGPTRPGPAAAAASTGAFPMKACSCVFSAEARMHKRTPATRGAH